MAFDPSIIMGYKGMGELPNPINQLAQVSQIQNAQNQNALAQYQLSAAQRAEQGQTATGQAYANFYTNQPKGVSGQPLFDQMREKIVGSLSTSAPHLIPGELAKIAAMEKEALQAKELQGKIDLQAPELQNKVSEQFRKQLVNVNNYDSAVQWLANQYKHPVMGPVVSQEPFDAAVKQIPKDPTAFQDWKNKNALGIEEYIKQNKPQNITENLGGTSRVSSIPGLGGAPTVISTTNKTATPGELLVDKRARERLDAELATGTLTPASMDVAANIYLQTGQLPQGMGKVAAGLRTQVMNRATELSTGKPAADVAGGIVESKQDVASRGQAVKAFATGKQGQQVNAFNTAIDHLGTMDKLSDALQNGDVKAFNALGNTVARQTGQPAPANFDAAKQIVTAEVIKAVVASGGGVTERQEAERNFAAANSPAQLKGVIDTYKQLLGGQLKSLNLQYENTTGRKDFDKKLTPDAKATLDKLRSTEAPAATQGSGGFKYLGKEG